MCDWFHKMDCYILAGGKTNRERDFENVGEDIQLARSFRRYAAIFDRVKLVIKSDQASEHYLNFPHVCDNLARTNTVVGVATALEDADSDAVFIGSSAIADFPPKLLVDLVKRYKGEQFLGYYDGKRSRDSRQMFFGIYDKRLARKLIDGEDTADAIAGLIGDEVTLIPLPEDVDSRLIGIK